VLCSEKEKVSIEKAAAKEGVSMACLIVFLLTNCVLRNL